MSDLDAYCEKNKITLIAQLNVDWNFLLAKSVEKQDAVRLSTPVQLLSSRYLLCGVEGAVRSKLGPIIKNSIVEGYRVSGLISKSDFNVAIRFNAWLGIIHFIFCSASHKEFMRGSHEVYLRCLNLLYGENYNVWDNEDVRNVREWLFMGGVTAGLSGNIDLAKEYADNIFSRISRPDDYGFFKAFKNVAVDRNEKEYEKFIRDWKTKIINRNGNAMPAPYVMMLHIFAEQTFHGG